MNKTFIYKTLYIVFSVNFAFSQIGYIKGIVVSENSDTLYGANIFIEGTQIGTSSDSDGSFIFRDLKPGRYVLNVNYIGYKSKTKELYISSDKSDTNENKNLLLEKIGIEDGNEKLESLEAPFYDNIIFMLPKDPLGLEEIVVAASKVKQKVTNAPGVVSIINANSIRRNIGVDDYTKLASFLKGVDVNYYGIQGASINARGFDGTANTRFRQYEDGVYLGELVTSLVFSPLASPPKESISKIEVLFGPQSALYGPDATQGLLNVIKKHPRYDKKNEMNISLHSSDKYRVGGRFTKSFDKLSYDIVFEASYAGELEYNNCTENCETLDDNQHSPIFYATDENNDGDYNDIGIDGTPESDTLKADFYSDMDQRKASLRTNLYYLLNNDAEVSLATKHQFGQGYAMGSAGPI